MRAYDIIKKKRDGQALSDAELRFLVKAFTDGTVADYQMAAFNMAVFFNGMSGAELATFTNAMLHSGTVIQLDNVKGIKVDKHSTGGVGDKVSLPLAPAVAACGVPVPMIAGRGLGHTGGTLDKLEAIPGFSVDISVEDYKAQIERMNLALIGQTAEVAPADKKLYALRDVTATVDCVPLIASSIMSKKLAEGIDALVLDVKVGTGAFMKTVEDAELLARTMVEIGQRMDKNVVALLTDMNQPLGRLVGNTLEVDESLDVLEGKGPQDMIDIVVEQGAEMLVMGGVASDLEDGRARLLKSLNDGSAREKFGELIEAQGGDRRVLDDRSLLPRTDNTLVFEATRDGVLSGVATEAVGIASMELGGGRKRHEDTIDFRVGLDIHARIGDTIQKGQPLATLYIGDIAPDAALARLKDAFVIGDDPVDAPALIKKRIAEGLV